MIPRVSRGAVFRYHDIADVGVVERGESKVSSVGRDPECDRGAQHFLCKSSSLINYNRSYSSIGRIRLFPSFSFSFLFFHRCFRFTLVNPVGYPVENDVRDAGVRYPSSVAATLEEHLIIDIVLVNVNQSVPRGRPFEQWYAIAIRDIRERSAVYVKKKKKEKKKKKKKKGERKKEREDKQFFYIHNIRIGVFFFIYIFGYYIRIYIYIIYVYRGINIIVIANE